MTPLRALWLKVNEPRIVAVAHATVYLLLLMAGLYALVNPPATLRSSP
ncbi:hypothetical protein [Pseudactinotalea sp. Z1748]